MFLRPSSVRKRLDTMEQEPFQTVGMRIRQEMVQPRDGVDLEKGEAESGVAAASTTTTTTTLPQGSAPSSSAAPQPPQGPPPPLGKYDYPARPLPYYAISKGVAAPPWHKARIGRLYVYSWDKNGDPLCIVGPCWPMCFLSGFLVCGGTAGVLAGFARDIPWACAIGAVLALISVVALACTAWRDPGIVQRRQEKRADNELYDEKSMTYRPRHAIYEHETGVLIESVDHFCPWTGTVIAKKNMCCFLVFTRVLCVLVLFAIAMVIWGVMRLIQPS